MQLVMTATCVCQLHCLQVKRFHVRDGVWTIDARTEPTSSLEFVFRLDNTVKTVEIPKEAERMTKKRRNLGGQQVL